MTNNQLLKKLSEDMKMRNFSHYTYDAYMGKTREMIRWSMGGQWGRRN